MALFKQVSIIGVGLIGGSLAKAMRKNRVATTIVGFFRNKQKKEKALRAKIVDRGCDSLKEAISASDLIVLALPVNQIIEFLPKLKKMVGEKTIIADIGSTKKSILDTADALSLNFIGTHPLAGSEKRGAEHSSADLFNDSLVILTPNKKSSLAALKKVRALYKQIHAHVIELPPRVHDTILSYTSHMPHLVAYALINSIPEKYLRYSACGLRDTTRIALSEAALWADIAHANKKEVLISLTRFEREVKKLKRTLKNKQQAPLLRQLQKSQKKRQKLTTTHP